MRVHLNNNKRVSTSQIRYFMLNVIDQRKTNQLKGFIAFFKIEVEKQENWVFFLM